MVIIKISLVCIWEYGLLCSSGQRLFKPFVVVCAFYLPSRSIQLASQCNSFYAKSSLQHLSKNPASHFELMDFCTYAVNRYKIVRRVYIVSTIQTTYQCICRCPVSFLMMVIWLVVREEGRPDFVVGRGISFLIICTLTINLFSSVCL